MGDVKFPTFGKKRELDLRSCADVLVVASTRYVNALSQALTSDAFPGIAIVEAEPGEAIPASAMDGSSLAVVEVDPADPRSLERIAQLHRSKAAMPIIAAISDASVALVRTLVREGVEDVIALPFDADDLLDTALNVLASQSPASAAHSALAPMVAVVRSTGGSGATSIATQLAGELAQKASGEVLVADLDLQFGAVADVLSTSGRGTLSDLLEAGERLDEDLVRSVVRETEDGIFVVAAPDEIMPLESVNTDQLLRVLDLLRRSYAYVVLDLPANWTNWTLSAAVTANVVLLVTEPSVPSLRQAKRRIDLFQSVGISSEHIAIVVNRFEKRLFRMIDLDDVAQTLHHSVAASIALDEPAVSSAQGQGRLVTGLHRKSRFGKDVAHLADVLLAGPLGGKK